MFFGAATVSGTLGFALGVVAFRRIFALLLRALCSRVDPAATPTLVEEEGDESAANALDRWWNFVSKQRLAPCCSTAQEAVRSLERARKLRKDAERYYYAKRVGGDPPSPVWIGGWRSFALHLDEDERVALASSLFLVTWHVCTVALALSPQYCGGLSAQLVWAANCGDLLLIALGVPNANNARRTNLLVLHHVVSLIGIPFILGGQFLSPDSKLRYTLFLELTGAFSALWNGTGLTPFGATKLHYATQLLALLISVWMRGPLFATLLVIMVREGLSASAPLWSLAVAAVLHSLMLWFNHAFLQALWKRAEQAARRANETFLQPTFAPKPLNAAVEIAVAYAQTQEAMVFATLYLVPVALQVASGWVSWVMAALLLASTFRFVHTHTHTHTHSLSLSLSLSHTRLFV
jgi:hypothetical protein